MTTQLNEENHASEKSTVNPGNATAKVGIVLSLMAIIVAVGAVGVGYNQLTKTNATLIQELSDLKQQSNGDAAQLQSLSQSVQQLQRANSVNDNEAITDIYTRLIAVNVQLDQLPLPPTPLQQTNTPVPVVDETNMSWWEKGLNRSLQALQKIVIVRYNENNMLPLVLPEDRHFLYQNLHAEMQNAIWGLLHRNATVYHASLARVNNWVQQYFMQSAPATAAVIQELTSLQSVDIRVQDSAIGGT